MACSNSTATQMGAIFTCALSGNAVNMVPWIQLRGLPGSERTWGLWYLIWCGRTEGRVAADQDLGKTNYLQTSFDKQVTRTVLQFSLFVATYLSLP